MVIEGVPSDEKPTVNRGEMFVQISIIYKNTNVLYPPAYPKLSQRRLVLAPILIISLLCNDHLNLLT